MAVRKHRTDNDAPENARDNVVEVPALRRLTVSETLRDRRIECGLEIPYVAEVLRIRAPVLSAIEDGRFDQLPGPAYAVGFVRAYARYLGLDAEALVLRFKAEAAEVARRPHLNFPLPLSESRVPTGTILVTAVVLAAAIYGGWYWFYGRHGQIGDLVSPVPDRLTRLIQPAPVAPPPVATPAPAAADTTAPSPQAAAVAPPAQTAAGTPPPAQASGVTAAPTVAAPAGPAAPVTQAAPAATAQPGAAASPGTQIAADAVPPVDARPAQPPVAGTPPAPELAPPAVADQPAKPATPGAYGATSGLVRVVLRAVADSWIQVRDAQGNLLITRVLKPGEIYNVPNQPGLTMVTGNAGGLDIDVDGTTLSRIGGSGQVARNVSLDPERLLAAHPHAN